MILNPFNDQFNTFANTYDNAIKKFQKQQIDEHEAYFKNKCERLIKKANTLKSALVILENDDWPDCPLGLCRPEPVNDTDAFSKTKAWEIYQRDNPPQTPYIDATNWQGLYNLWMNYMHNPAPSWFRAEFWPSHPGDIQDCWYNFCSHVTGAIQRAGQNNSPDFYLDVVSRWNGHTAAANGGIPIRFPVINSAGISYSARHY